MFSNIYLYFYLLDICYMATQKNFSVSDIESKLAGVKGQIDKHSKADEKSHSTSITYA